MHPPLQYILNKVFYDSLNDWSLVRVISSLLFCFASIFYVERKRIELETPNHQLIKKVYIIRTFTGPRPPEVFNPLMSSLENFEHSAQFVKTYKLGEDHYYSIKQKLDPSYPQFSLQMDVYEGKLSPNSLIEWNKKIY